MKRKIIKLSFWIAVALIGLFGLISQAQDNSAGKSQSKVKEDVLFQSWEAAAPAVAVGMVSDEPFMLPFGNPDVTMKFISSEFEPMGKVVQGAPYSAEVVSESVQTLSDGNRIIHKSSSSIFRDGEGRTRREQNLSGLGGLSTDNEPLQIIFINDPVAGVNYILHPNDKSASKIVLGKMIPPHATGGKPGDVVEFNVQTISPGAGQMHYEKRIIRHEGDSDSENFKKESLGSQLIEGVKAEGTRVTTIIPAGKIGNESPITIVNETWYSPELQTLVLSKNNDPRMGENTYRLININRTEPARSLFEVPADYKVEEGKSQIMIHKEIKK